MSTKKAPHNAALFFAFFSHFFVKESRHDTMKSEKNSLNLQKIKRKKVLPDSASAQNDIEDG